MPTVGVLTVLLKALESSGDPGALPASCRRAFSPLFFRESWRRPSKTHSKSDISMLLLQKKQQFSHSKLITTWNSMPREPRRLLGASGALLGASISQKTQFPGLKNKKSNFQLLKGPCGHDARNKGFEKLKKSIFQLPKGPCGQDIRSIELGKTFKSSSRQLKMGKCVFMKKWNLYCKNTIKSNFLMKNW